MDTPQLQQSQLAQVAAVLGGAMGAQAGDPAVMQKALAASTGFANYQLIRLAKLLLPVMAPITNRMPAEADTIGGTMAHYKTVNGYGSFAMGDAMGSDEAAIGTDVTLTPTDMAAVFSSQALSNSVTIEAVDAIRRAPCSVMAVTE